MPSGAKKRKAAKKKREKGANSTTNSATQPYGDDDLKVHNGREGDGGGVSSPQYEHADDSHPTTEGEEEELDKREDPPSVRSNDTEIELLVQNNGETTQEVLLEEKGVVQISRELEPNDGHVKVNIAVESVDSVKEPPIHLSETHENASNSSSSSSSSDDESPCIEKNIVMIESSESKEDAYYPVVDLASFVATKPADLPELTQAANDAAILEVFNPSLGEHKEEAVARVAFVDLAKPNDLPEAAHVSDGVPFLEAYNSVADEPDKKDYNSVSNAVSDSVNHAALAEDGEASGALSIKEANISGAVKSNEEGTAHLIDLDKFSLTNEVVQVNVIAPEENVASPGAEAGLKENGETVTLLLNEITEISTSVMDTGSQLKVNKQVSPAVYSEAVVAVNPEHDSKYLLSASVSSAVTSNGNDHAKDSKAPESVDSQPLVASAPQVLQTTSWKSFCGLFELFTGSNR